MQLMQTWIQAAPKLELALTQGIIAMGMVHAGEGEGFKDLVGSDFESYKSSPDNVREGIAIAAGLEAFPEPARVLEAALRDERPNVNFGGALGTIQWILDNGVFPAEDFQALIQKMIMSEYFDGSSLALLAYGLQLWNASDAQAALPFIEQAITIDEPYEKRVAAVLASVLAHVTFPDKYRAMQDFRKYLDAGGWAIMATGPALALMLISDRIPITMAEFEASPFFLPSPDQDIYCMNAFLLAITILASNGANDIRDFVLQAFSECGPQEMARLPDVACVFQACQGVLATVADNPREYFLRLLREEFGPVLENPGTDFDATRAKMGAALGIGLALYFARVQAGGASQNQSRDLQIATVDGITEELLTEVTRLLSFVLDGPASEAAIVALVAGAADLEFFRKFLLIYAAYQISLGDYTYYKILLIILAVFLIVHAKFAGK